MTVKQILIRDWLEADCDVLGALEEVRARGEEIGVDVGIAQVRRSLELLRELILIPEDDPAIAEDRMELIRVAQLRHASKSTAAQGSLNRMTMNLSDRCGLLVAELLRLKEKIDRGEKTHPSEALRHLEESAWQPLYREFLQSGEEIPPETLRSLKNALQAFLER